jgi:bacterioferritin (cytochrome b1)
MTLTITDDELWILSFYRASEISGALFFGRLARSLKPGTIQNDLTKHFSDEARHAVLWTACVAEVGGEPLRLDNAYQDRYLAAAGIPANLMEVLAITQVFEQRVLRQYSHHLAMTGIHPAVHRTLTQIMEDEKWHIEWIRRELKGMEAEWGHESIRETLKRFQAADQSIYDALVAENEDRIAYVAKKRLAIPSPASPS